MVKSLLRGFHVVVISIAIFLPALSDNQASAEPPPTPSGSPESDASDDMPNQPERDRLAHVDVHHVPLSVLDAGQGFKVEATIRPEHRIIAAWLDVGPSRQALRHPIFDSFANDCRESQATWLPELNVCRFPLRRSAKPAVFTASIPGELVQPPGVTYTIAYETRDGLVEHGFGSHAHPHPVVVSGVSKASRRADRLARHQGRTSQVAVHGEGTAFGSADLSQRYDPTTGQPGGDSERFSDYYFLFEAEYTSRPLTLAYAFTLGLGVMRGERARFQDADGRMRTLGDGPQPGLNYGFGEVVFELHPIVYITPRLTLGASEAGFSAGFGAEFQIGRMESTHFVTGFDAITGLGVRGWFGFHWYTIPGVPMGLTLELTDWPNGNSNDLGTRLLYDVAFEISDFTLKVRAGYAQRATSYEGGFVVGLGATYDF